MMLDRYMREIFDPRKHTYALRHQIAEKVVPVDIIDAARIFYTNFFGRSRSERWDWASTLPAMLSPWPVAWYEWELRDDSGRMGALVLRSAIEGGSNLDPCSYVPGAEPVYLPEVAYWLQDIYLFEERPGRRIVYLGWATEHLNKDGRFIREIDGSTRDARKILLASEDTQSPISMPVDIDATLLPYTFAISLLHCKNVTLIDKPVPEKVQRARARRGKEPKFVYKTLEIEPMKQILRTEGQVEKVGLKQALHVCRGHFKDYREKGLFGKESHKGIYWWDMHVRGTLEAGAVVKDYRVLAPKQKH